MRTDAVIFSETWERYFHGLGLKTFDDFYEVTDGETINTNRRRNVQKIILGTGDDRHVFFMKRFHDPHLKDVIAAACRFGRPMSQARVEWENAHALLRGGFDTYRPVCFGQRTRWGFERSSFFITRQLEAVCLVDDVMDRWATRDRGDQDRMIKAMAHLAKRLHDGKISVPDLYVWHLFIWPVVPDGPVQFSLIDLHRMMPKRRGASWKMKELTRLYWSLLSDFFDADHKSLLLDTYFADLSDRTKRSRFKAIQTYSAILDKRRTLSRYYKRSQ
jgi:lipopolysaccharide kinase (Kdo/WaaP) family protein